MERKRLVELSALPVIGLISACGGAAATAPESHSAPPQATLASDGLVEVVSEQSFEDTVATLESAIASRDLSLMATIPHSQAAAEASVSLRPTTLLIFGRPQIGSPLMAAAPTLGLDLPQRMLVVESEGRVLIVYNDPRYLAARHQLSGHSEALGRVAGALSAIAEDGAGR